jgi:kumamolisin
MDKSRVSLPGSERNPTITSNVTANTEKPDPQEIIEVTVSVRRRKRIPVSVTHKGKLNHAELEKKYGASEEDFKAISAFAERYNLKVVEKNPLALYVKLSGTLQDLEQAFGASVYSVTINNHAYRERQGVLTIPASLEGIVEGVFGLDNRPQAYPRFRLAPKTDLSLTAIQVADLYNFPKATGQGQIISLIELGGGFVTKDLDQYFSGLGLSTPNVVAVPVSGGSNAPTGNSGSADGEVMLDIEVAGAVAPQSTIKVYFAPNSDKGFLDAINAAIYDTQPPTVVSISWGGPEQTWTAQMRDAFEKAFQGAATLSIPVTAASGDAGSSDGTGSLAVDFPASAPHVLGCGGTHLEGKNTISTEVVWNSNGGATGGGVSAVFPIPAYQTSMPMPPSPTNAGGRGVPDICGNAAPETGYKVRVDGTDAVIGGTSAVAPLWAGLIARLAQLTGKKVPFLNPVLYANKNSLRDITQGNNDVGDGGGKYQAGVGWDACTGLGSPDGSAILSVLSKQ